MLVANCMSHATVSNRNVLTVLKRTTPSSLFFSIGGSNKKTVALLHVLVHEKKRVEFLKALAWLKHLQA
jgi:hypothetical protein